MATCLSSSNKTKLNLLIRAKEESWVKITADGQTLMEGMMPPSIGRTFKAERELAVRLGNAAAVELSYNGKPLPPFAPDTKTKTLTFTSESKTIQ